MKFPSPQNDLKFFEHTLQHFLDKIQPSLTQKFDDANIRLWETRSYYTNYDDNRKLLPINWILYLSVLKHSRWYGPYKNPRTETF